jgi:hypothetical protein
MTFTKVEVPVDKYSKVSIKPFFEDKENMGLEKYGLSLHDGVEHEEQLACIELNGVTRYLTGLDEFAPEVKMLPESEREARVKQIRETVSELEKSLASNVIEPKDKDFWNKVTLLKPNNHSFWSKISLRAGNNTIFLNPKENPYDLIKLKAIEAGGFSMVAKSYESAKKASKAPKFYLDKLEETVTLKNEIKKTRNKALAELQDMFEKQSKKLFFVAKVVDGNSTIYRENTQIEVIYDAMDSFINGEGVEKSKMRAAETFIKVAQMSLEDLTIRAMIKDATYNKYVTLKSDGFIYETETGIMLGQTPQDVFEYLKNPLHDEVFFRIKEKTEAFWKN